MVEVAGREAFEKTSSFATSVRKRGAFLVANPEYNAGSPALVAKSFYDEGTQKLVTRAFANRSLSFTDLPGADEEVTHLSASLDSWGARNVGVLRGNDASEQAVLEALDTSGMAHIATHGFYLDMISATDERAKPLLNELKNSNNPYFRSGLALAGANHTLGEWSKGNVTGSPVDGVLLAAEVRNLDLSNLSLLVLSACSTAEGKPVDGKSVASLRDAFLQAGVETLVSTLWDIPDDFAVKLMGDFYEHLLAGETPSIALWRAKKDNFLELRKTTGFAESMVKVAPFVAVTQAAKPD
jgi:CHAT domain-containing protein